MTDEELRNLVANTAQATAANTAGLAESRRLLDEGLTRSQQLTDANAAGLAESQRLIDANTEGFAESQRLFDERLARSQQLIDANTEGFAETRQLINSNARATEANSDAISKLSEKVDQIDDAVVGLFERLDERLDRLTNEFNHRLGQLIDLHMANAREHADFIARSRQHDQQIQMLIEENRADRQQASADRKALREELAADRAAFLSRGENSDRKHLAATELMQQMFGEIQNINQRLAS